MHHDTREYLRASLQRDLAKLIGDVPHIGDVLQLTDTLNSIRKLTLILQDLMTHDALPAPVPEEDRKGKAARRLYNEVLKGADTVRDLEVLLGTGDMANGRQHNFIRHMREFVQRESTTLAAEEIASQLPAPSIVAEATLIDKNTRMSRKAAN